MVAMNYNLIAVSAFTFKEPIQVVTFLDMLDAIEDQETMQMLNLSQILSYEIAYWNTYKWAFCSDNQECIDRMFNEIDELRNLKVRVPEFIRNITWGRVCLKTQLKSGPAHVYMTQNYVNGFHQARVTRDIGRGSYFWIFQYVIGGDVYQINFRDGFGDLSVPINSSSTEPKVHTSHRISPATLWKIIPVEPDKINKIYLYNTYNKQYLYQTGVDSRDGNVDLDTRAKKDSSAVFEMISCNPY